MRLLTFAFRGTLEVCFRAEKTVFGRLPAYSPQTPLSEINLTDPKLPANSLYKPHPLQKRISGGRGGARAGGRENTPPESHEMQVVERRTFAPTGDHSPVRAGVCLVT